MVKNIQSSRLPNKALYLKCKACGNADRFIEIMECESHLVDGNLNYVRLADAVTDHYTCCTCGEQVPVRGRNRRKQIDE